MTTDLTMYRLSKTRYRLKVHSDPEQTVPIDLDGLDLLFLAKVKLTDTDEDAVFSLTLGNGLEIDPEVPEGNEVIATIESEDTEELSETKSVSLYAELLVTGEDRQTLGSTIIPVKPSVKRS